MKNLFLILFVSTFFYGCSTDFDVVAPYKETMVIYGLLNPIDTIQYIRISKAYLGEGNALIMAQQADSIYYGDFLDVKIERYFNNGLQESHSLARVDTIPKDAGIFSYPGQIFYAYKFALKNDESVYKLTVTNTKTGLFATSQTSIIPYIKGSGSEFNIVDPTEGKKLDFVSLPATRHFTIQTSKRGKVYSMIIKVNYIETDIATSISQLKSFDWNLGEQTVLVNSLTTTQINFSLEKREFFKQLSYHIPVDAGKTRTFTGIAPLVISGLAGTEELYTYIQLTKPSFGIVQDRPVYTNIDNGVGIFTGRTIQMVEDSLSAITISALDTSEFTKNLNFIH